MPSRQEVIDATLNVASHVVPGATPEVVQAFKDAEAMLRVWWAGEPDQQNDVAVSRLGSWCGSLMLRIDVDAMQGWGFMDRPTDMQCHLNPLGAIDVCTAAMWWTTHPPVEEPN